jgi:hypothetical protein
VPFGLAAGAQILTRLLDDLIFMYVYHYLDSLVVYSETFEQHLQHVDEILRRFRDAGLVVNPEKIRLAVREICFLGYIASPEGIRVDVERTQAIREFSPPKDIRGIAHFLAWLISVVSSPPILRKVQRLRTPCPRGEHGSIGGLNKSKLSKIERWQLPSLQFYVWRIFPQLLF